MRLSLPLLETTPAPQAPLIHLDELWFQVTGTVCNLTCRHCFISCSPHNHRFAFLTLEQVEQALEESVALGVKEYYFTGGEPFLHRDLVPMLERTLRYGPATVLTNGTVLRETWLERLRRAEEESPYSLEFRVSLDGVTAEANDAIRGAGTFQRILAGIRKLLTFGFLPLITVTQVDEELAEAELVAQLVRLLQEQGYDRPRIKLLPLLRLGAEVERHRGYHPQERVTPEMLDGYDVGRLLCSRARVVTSQGIFVCPILLEAADAWLGESLSQALRPYALRHQACYTCYQYGALCANPSAGGRDA
jgi:molybdenum cofactor biosynthesis enzyme MoaA